MTYLDNPVDMGFRWMPPIFIEVARTIVADPQVDVLIIYFLPLPGPMVEQILSQALSAREPGKLLIFGTDNPDASMYGSLAELEGMEVPVFLSPGRVARALAHKVEYDRMRRGRAQTNDREVSGTAWIRLMPYSVLSLRSRIISESSEPLMTLMEQWARIPMTSPIQLK